MPTNLTARTVANLKPRATAFYQSDTTISGLAVRVAPDGAKTWSLRYRVGRRQRRLTLGSYAVLTLADARQRAKDALKLVSAGVDPGQTKQDRRDADTVSDFAKTYIEKHAKPRKKSWKVDQRRLNIDVLPLWTHRLMKDITRRDVRELLDAIAARPAPIVANRVRSLLHKLFNVAIELGIVEVNPVTATRRPGVEQQRDRVLTHDEMRTFWTACDALPLEMRAAWTLRLLTAQRGGEVYGMHWQDVDLEGGWWTIPAGLSKNKLAHRVPLSAAAVDILREVRAKADERMKTQKHPKPSVFVLRTARGKRQQAEAAATFNIDDFRGHDLRRSAASSMASSGVSRLVISKILNHVERGVTAVYDRHSYDAEKRIALDAWARTLTNIIEQKDSATVVAFARS
jgi:integrase